MSGHASPLTLSDIPCETCGLYFTLDGDLMDHRASEHGTPPRDGIVHLFDGYPDGGQDVVKSTITLCCKRSALDSTLQFGTVIPENCTCPEFVPTSAVSGASDA